MTSQALIDVPPETRPGQPGTGPAQPDQPAAAWRPPAPGIPLRQRLTCWRARHWRRLVLGWFVLSLAVLAVAAEPGAYFPKAQARTVPAVRTVLRVAGGVTTAGVALVLIVLP